MTVLLPALLKYSEVAEKSNLGYITGDEQEQKSSHPETSAQDYEAQGKKKSRAKGQEVIASIAVYEISLSSYR